MSVSESVCRNAPYISVGFFTDDADGNLLPDGCWPYTYDAENRRVRLESQVRMPASGVS